jgi:ectoine hydroxylase-related dioxygenase (phytanoyl-CoA dioxygenase family)
MDFQAALQDLGVHAGLLSDDERRALDTDGFVILHGVVDATTLARLRAAMEEAFAAERAAPGGGRDCDLLESRSPAFDICLTHPRIQAAIAHILRGDFTSSGVHARPNPPGFMHQALHADTDAPPPGASGLPHTANSIWMLDDFTAENGATRVIPGSHRAPRRAGEALADPTAAHPDQVQLCAPAGSVAVYDGHLWHGAWMNRSDRPRANVTSFWRRRSSPHGMVVPDLPDEALMRLPAGARALCAHRSRVAP